MTITDYIKLTYFEEGHGEKNNIEHLYTLRKYHIRQRVFCNDGFDISIQGNEGAYCSPRMFTDDYSSMELGYPSEKEDLLLEFAEEPDNPINTVYGYVPFDIIEKIIEKHGGINIMKTIEKCTEPNIEIYRKRIERIKKLGRILK